MDEGTHKGAKQGWDQVNASELDGLKPVTEDW
jgi:hypothetical protein